MSVNRLWQRFTAIAAAVAIVHLAAFAAAMGLDLPRRLVLAALSPWIAGRVSIRAASVTFPPGIAARGVRIELPPGAEGGSASLGVTRLRANLPVRRIVLEGLDGTIVADREGHVPLARLLGPAARMRPSDAPPHIRIVGGELTLVAPHAPPPLRPPFTLRATGLEGRIGSRRGATSPRGTLEGHLEGIGMLRASVGLDHDRGRLTTRLELSGIDASNRSFWERALGGATFHDAWDVQGDLRLTLTSHTTMGGEAPAREPGRFQLFLEDGSILWPGRAPRLAIPQAAIEGGPNAWKVHATGNVEDGSLSLDLEARFSHARRPAARLEAHGRARGMPWDPELSRTLEEILGPRAGWLSCVSGTGAVDLDTTITIDAKDGLSHSIEAALRGGQGRFVGLDRDDLPHIPGFPLPLRDIEGSAHFDDDGATIQIRTAHGEGGGSITGSIVVSRDPSSPDPETPRARVNLAFRDLPLDDALRRAFTAGEEHRAHVWDSLRPAGRLTGTFDLDTGVERPGDVDLAARVSEGELRPTVFPLALSSLAGTLRLTQGRISVNLEGRHPSGGSATVRGSFGAAPPAHRPLTLDVGLRSLPVSREARDALLATAPGAVRELDALGLEGLADVDVKVERGESGASRWSLEGELRQGRCAAISPSLPCDITLARFSLHAEGNQAALAVAPLRASLLGTRLEGSLRADLARGGEAGGGEAGRGEAGGGEDSGREGRTGAKGWRVRPRMASLHFEDLPVERALLQAMEASDAAELQRLASWLEPGGLVTAAAVWSGTPSGPLLPSLHADAHFGGLHLHPPGGNLVLRDASGRVRIEEGRILLDAFGARLGDAPLQLRGAVIPREGGARLVGEGGFRNLSVPSLASVLLSEGARDDLPRSDLPPFARGGSLTAERLEAALDIGEEGLARGEIQVDGRVVDALDDPSLPLRKLTGHVVASMLLDGGAFASLEGSLTGGEARLFGWPARSLQAGIRLQRDQLSIDRLLGTVAGGTLTPGRNRLEIELDPRGWFRLAADLRGASLGELLAPAQGRPRVPLHGRVDLVLPRLEGAVSSIETLQGEGHLLVTNGTLWEIPLLRGIRRYLSLPGSVYFDRAEARLQIEGGAIHLEGVRLHSPILTVAGEGVVRPDGTCDFLLAPRLQHLLSGIDLLDPLWQAVVGEVLSFHVHGPLENPVTVPQNLASQLLDRLFGEPERGRRPPVFRVPPIGDPRRF